jgi:D-glycero-D-manno-heptose 1,7-bisphosphate phosphatase
VAVYRAVCDCRKPRPGLLLRAAADLGLDLEASVMVGDAASDIEAGRRAGCRTVLLRAAGEPGASDVSGADHVAADLAAAADWILTTPSASGAVPRVDPGRDTPNL